MPDFVYPTNAELREIEQDLVPRLQQDRPIFAIMPIEEVDANIVMWEQEGNYIGVQQIRGMNGEPQRVKRVGGTRINVTPGIFGEFLNVDEMELTSRRDYGTFGTPIDLSSVIMKLQNQLLQRQLDLQEQIGWKLLTTGTYSVLDGEGVTAFTDTITWQTFTASVPWATHATATPLADARAIKLKHRGHSVSFGRDSKWYMNQTTVNDMLLNTNAADLGGKRVDFGNTVLTLENINKIMIGNDLPQIVPYDEGYLDDSNTFQLYIANAAGVVVGKRQTGVPIMTYAMTRNANNPNMAPGTYVYVVDSANYGKPVPRSIQVHRGHNGAPKVEFPSSAVQTTL